MKIYLVEENNNKELCDYLNKKHVLVTKSRIKEAKVIIVNKVNNVKNALDIVDFGLSQGKEIICIKNNFAKEHYVCNYLIKNGANYI